MRIAETGYCYSKTKIQVMKQLNALITLCFIAAFVLLVASCSKEGPAGPAGATGPAGPAGAAGAAGPKGDTGVANVIYSAWLDAIYLLDTVKQGNVVIDTLGWYVDAVVPKLTNSILTTGEIKVYVNLGSAATPAIIPLPYFDPSSFLSINPLFSAASISLYANAPVSTYTDATGAKRQQWRYILIPGGKPARSAINWNNYAEVQQYLGLKD
jgi:hypothetical protein